MKLAYPIATPEVRSAILGLKGPPAESLRALRDAGYDAVEPFVADPEKFDAEGWARAVEQAGLSVVAVGTGPMVFDDQLTFTSADAGVRRSAILRAKAGVRFAARLGAQLNIGKLRGDLSTTHPEQSWAWMREAFIEVCAEADRCAIPVTIEPQSRGIINNLNTTASALAFLGQLKLPNLRLMLDTFHLEAEGEEIGAALRAVAAADALLHVHFADTGRLSPGAGRIDFPAVVAALRSVGYRRGITVEIKQEPDALAAARRSAAYLQPLLSRV